MVARRGRQAARSDSGPAGLQGTRLCLFPACGAIGGAARAVGGGSMSTSVSGGAEACERLGSGGLGRPRWGVVAAGGSGVGAVGARSIAKTITIVLRMDCRKRARTAPGLDLK